MTREALLARVGALSWVMGRGRNTSAIEIFRRSGDRLHRPMQDVVERAGDKRKFRLLAEAIDPKAVDARYRHGRF